MSNICMAFIGDLMFCGEVEGYIKKTGNYGYPLEKIKSTLTQTDSVLANLETVISRDKIAQKFVPVDKYYTDPQIIPGLVDSNIKIINLANNHIYDYGYEGVETTIDSLLKADIQSVGIGQRYDSCDPVIHVIKGTRFAFLSYCSASTVVNKINKYVVCPAENEFISKDIAKIAGQVDHVIVSIHKGTSIYPSPEFRQLAKHAIDSGACLVVGHHPHVINGLEKYKDGLIAYGLGNFVADFAQEIYRQSFILKCTFSKTRILDHQTIPIWINDHFQPEIAIDQQAEEIRKRIDSLSQLLVTGENDSAYFHEMKQSYWPMQYREVIRSFKAEGWPAIFRKIKKIRKHHLRLLWHKLVN